MRECVVNAKFNAVIANQKISHNLTSLHKNPYTAKERKAILRHNESLSKKLSSYTERIQTLEKQYMLLSTHLFDEIRFLECRLQGVVPADILTQAIKNGNKHANDAKRKPNTLQEYFDTTAADSTRVGQIDILYKKTLAPDTDRSSVDPMSDSVSVDTSSSTIYPSSVGGSLPSVPAPPPVGSLMVSKSMDTLPTDAASGSALSMRDRIALLLSQDRPLGQTGTMPLAPIVKKRAADEIREKFKHSSKAKVAAAQAAMDDKSVKSKGKISDEDSVDESVLSAAYYSDDTVTVSGNSKAANVVAISAQGKPSQSFNKPYSNKIMLKKLPFGGSLVQSDEVSLQSFSTSGTNQSGVSSVRSKRRVDPPPPTMLTSLTRKIDLKPVGAHGKHMHK